MFIYESLGLGSRERDLKEEVLLLFFWTDEERSRELLLDFTDAEDYERSRIILCIFGFLRDAFEVLIDCSLCLVAH